MFVSTFSCVVCVFMASIGAVLCVGALSAIVLGALRHSPTLSCARICGSVAVGVCGECGARIGERVGCVARVGACAVRRAANCSERDQSSSEQLVAPDRFSPNRPRIRLIVHLGRRLRAERTNLVRYRRRGAGARKGGIGQATDTKNAT